MSIGKFRAEGPNNYKGNGSSSPQSLSDATEAVVELYNKKVKVTKGKIRDVTRGLAEIAYSMGETNDPENYASEMEEDIMLALEEAIRRDKKRKQENKGY